VASGNGPVPTPETAPGEDTPRDYTRDVFISYHRQARTKIWIRSHFYDLFQGWLEIELGRKVSVFYDEDDVDTGDLWAEKILNRLKTSKCIVPIWSRGYFSSRWCVAEWETFRLRTAALKMSTTGLVIPIRWQDGDLYPPQAQAIKPADFRTYAYTTTVFPAERAGAYEDDVKKLANLVAEKIESAPKYDATWPIVQPDDLTMQPNDLGIEHIRLRQ
jgi:hypothetical protein